MPNTRNVVAGLELQDKYGAYIKHSFLFNDPDMSKNMKQQYLRAGAFYRWSLTDFMDGYYLVYGGSRYDKMYWDVGARVDLLYNLQNYLNAEFAFQPYYDSELGLWNGYLIKVGGPTFKRMNAYVGFKNIPEYRVAERRLSFGMKFESEDLIVDCEVSSPTSWKTQFTRVSIGFLYNFKI